MFKVGIQPHGYFKESEFIKISGLLYNKIYVLCQIAYRRGNSLLNASVTHILSAFWEVLNIVSKGTYISEKRIL